MDLKVLVCGFNDVHQSFEFDYRQPFYVGFSVSFSRVKLEYR